MVIGFDVEAADADGQEAGAGWVGADVLGDVDCVDDLRQACQRWVGVQVVVLDEDLEGAVAVAVGVPRTGRVKAGRSRGLAKGNARFWSAGNHCWTSGLGIGHGGGAPGLPGLPGLPHF